MVQAIKTITITISIIIGIFLLLSLFKTKSLHQYRHNKTKDTLDFRVAQTRITFKRKKKMKISSKLLSNFLQVIKREN